MKYLNSICILILSVFLFTSCEKENSFQNKLYIKSEKKVNEVLLKAGISEIEKTIQAELAKPAEQEINITYKTDASLVSKYNQGYYDNAVMLPSENFELIQPKASINQGGVLSTEAKVLFKDLQTLDREIVYVLPITIANANIDVLESAQTYYYVLKAAALINVVADIEKNYLSIDWKNPGVCNNLTKVTLEALIRAKDFDKMISTVMGIESRFLIRIGDAGFPFNQIQIATSNGNFPDANTQKALPVKEWVHIALTYNLENEHIIVYVNGKKQSEGSKYIGRINLGSPDFFIGRSWDDNRWLSGEISECRIWNIIRTEEEIAANPYYVDPNSEGLVAYWKFDEGAGNIVKDHTGNGNNAIANKTLIWNPVTLPNPDK